MASVPQDEPGGTRKRNHGAKSDFEKSGNEMGGKALEELQLGIERGKSQLVRPHSWVLRFGQRKPVC